MAPSKRRQQLLYRGLMLTAAAGLGVFAWLGASLPTTVAPGVPVQPPTATAPGNGCLMDQEGYLNGRVYGAIERRIEWHGPSLDCGGMLRPGHTGIRLFFSTMKAGLRLVVGIDGEPGELAGGEHPANVTIIEEPAGRFFSTAGQQRCWARIDSTAGYGGRDHRQLRVTGRLYCAGALPSLGDAASVTLGDFEFSGHLALEDD